MSDDSVSWYQRKLAALRREQPAPPPYPAAYRPQAPAQQQQHFQGVPRAPQPQPQPQFDGRVTTENIYEAAGFWKGGPAAKTDTQQCPNCGSGQYFSRRVSKRGPEPAPHCYNCGFNDGMFEQGLATSWGATG